MKKWISIILAAAFLGVSVNAIAQGKKGDAKKDGKQVSADKKDDKKKGAKK